MESDMDQCGYDVRFLTDIPDELKCLICHLVLRDPVQIMTCGHRFCSPCFNRMKCHALQRNIDLLCPADREVVSLGHVFPDKAACRTIGNLKVHCGNSDRGCQWINDLRDLNSHEEGCEFRIVSGMQRMMIPNRSGEELNMVIQQIMSRVVSCENALVEKDKELLNLQVTLSELQESDKLKDEEIRMLKLSNAELRAESAANCKEVKEFRECINVLLKDVDSTKQTTDQLTHRINPVQSNVLILEKEIKELKEKSNIHVYDMPMMKKESETEQSVKVLKNELFKQVENIQNLLFAHQQLQETNEVEFGWVMPDYLNKFNVGEPVYSPLFHTKICGYSFMLKVVWKRPNKKQMGLHFYLHKGETPPKEFGNFNHEFTLAFHGKNGRKETRRVLFSDILKLKDSCFVIKDGKDVTDLGCGYANMLNAPFDDFVINNSLLTSCIVHL